MIEGLPQYYLFTKPSLQWDVTKLPRRGDAVPYLAFLACLLDQGVPPDGLEGHFLPVVAPLPNVRESSSCDARVGRLELNREDVRLGQSLQAGT